MDDVTMMPFVSNIRFIVQSLSKDNNTFLDEEEKFQERLLRLSDSTFSTPLHNLSPTLRTLQENLIQDCVVGPEHLAFLFVDGRVCRVAYTAALKSATKATDESGKEKPKSGTWTRWGSRGNVKPSAASGATLSAESSSARKTIRSSSNSNSSDSLTNSGIRLIRASHVRGRNLPIFSGGQKVVVPASHVPEELINQVQNVLQGKSRSVILRELQRTHLDVNMAVNNLLSRDDEDNDDVDDGASDYIPGEELMSLLDGGIPPGDHARVVIDADAMLPEDILGYTLTSRALSSNRRPDNEERDESSASRQHSAQWQEAKTGNAKLNGPKESDLLLSDEMQWWRENNEFVKFKQIGAMFSSLVATDVTGGLRQWRWNSTEGGLHPKSKSLNLDKEKVAHLSTSLTQASVATEDGAIATWMDDSLSMFSKSLDIPCTVCDAIKHERVRSLSVCSLYSAVLTEQDRVYWWGLLPFHQRRKVIEKSQSHLQQSLDKDTNKQNLSVGDMVCLKSVPIYHAGALAVHIGNGFPKVGRLLQSVWQLDTKRLFAVMPTLPTEDKSETQEEPIVSSEKEPNTAPKTILSQWKSFMMNSPVDSTQPRKRKRSDVDDVDYHDETWDLREVMFVEDARSLPVGRVTKVDGNILAVYFTSDKQNEGESPDFKDPAKIPPACRLLHKDDVMLVKSGSPKPLDCMQKSPKRVMLDPRFQLHCVNATEGGITAIASHDRGKLSYLRLSLTSGKMTSQRRFPTKADSFFYKDGEETSGKFAKSRPKLISCGLGSPSLLQDYNSMLYPLLGDENGGIRDPIWADIPPLCASGMGFCMDSFNARSAVVVLAFRTQLLLPLIMSRDLKGFQAMLTNVEDHPDAPWTAMFFQSLLRERCDGQRNILHMCIEMSIPSSNKEQKEDEEAQSKMATKRAAPLRSSPAKSAPKAPAPSAPVVSIGDSFMSDGDRINAVSAIASAISCVKTSSPYRSAAPREGQSPSKPPFPPMPPVYVPPRHDQSAFPNLPRSSSEFLGKIASPPGSPVMSWPHEPTWKYEEKREEEEGINLSKKKSKDTWTEMVNERGSRSDAVSILKLICKSPCIQPYLNKLLTHKDACGYTPFMFAVAHRAYPAALAIFKAAFSLAIDCQTGDKDRGKVSSANDSVDQNALLSMLYPPGSTPDDNPMYMLCCNDTCSFTWTGALHINQDIFECLTCGLTETLCCCTECAMVCHKGHDCKLKRTSPTAYCDCWEKCACRSLVEGSTPDRTALLRVLLHTTNLYERHNSKGQHIIHFLVRTVARQLEEQRQCRPPPRSVQSMPRHYDDQRLHFRGIHRTARMSTGGMRHRIANRTLPAGGEQDMPEHDLRPPQFCREALLQLLSDWHAVRSLLFTGCKGRRDPLSMSSKLEDGDAPGNLLPEDQFLLSSQSGTSRLDAFTHCILVKCSSTEYLDRLLETLIHAVQVNKHREHDDGVIMARRFLRSVIRLFIVLTAQATPDKMAARQSLYNQSAIAKCRRVFTALITLSIEELCETAESLIAPVRMGVAKPTATYSLFSANLDIVHGSTAAFSRLPFPPRTHLSDDDDDADQDKPVKSALKKTEKKRKKAKARKSVEGEAARSQEAGHDEEPDQGASQDSQPVEEEPMDGLRRLFRNISEQIDADARNDDIVDDDDESDMEITDIELAPESDSDTADTDAQEQPTVYLGGRRSQERESQHDDEDEDTEQRRNDDEDTDSDHWQDEVDLERRSTREQRAQAREAPHAMQWAMGTSSDAPTKDPVPTGSSRPPSGGMGSSSNGGVIYMNSRPVRRNDTSLENAYINTVLDRHHGITRPKQGGHVKSRASASVTNAQLSRLFSTCIREIVLLLTSLRSGSYMGATTLGTLLEVSFQESSELRDHVHAFLGRTWQWLLHIVESTEAQLRFGQVLSLTSSPHHPEHPQFQVGSGPRRPRSLPHHHSNQPTSEDTSARQDFLSYALSLMRSHSNEHSDVLPVVDVSSLKHVAYVLDAYIYYLRMLSWKEEGKQTAAHGISLDIGYDNSENEEEEEEQITYQDDLYSAALQSDPVKPPPPHTSFPDDCTALAQPSSLFFHRSESMTFLGCSDPSSFEVPLSAAIPLAEKPHLLRPNFRKEELFGRTRCPTTDIRTQSSSLSLSTRTTSMSVRETTTCTNQVKPQGQNSTTASKIENLPKPHSSEPSNPPNNVPPNNVPPNSPNDVPPNLPNNMSPNPSNEVPPPLYSLLDLSSSSDASTRNNGESLDLSKDAELPDPTFTVAAPASAADASACDETSTNAVATEMPANNPVSVATSAHVSAPAKVAASVSPPVEVASVVSAPVEMIVADISAFVENIDEVLRHVEDMPDVSAPSAMSANVSAPAKLSADNSAPVEMSVDESNPVEDAGGPVAGSGAGPHHAQEDHPGAEGRGAAAEEEQLDSVPMETPAAVTTVTVAMAEEKNRDEPCSSKSLPKNPIEKEVVSAQTVLAKCRLTLELFSRMFLDSVGAETKSILHELGGFEVREMKFRKEMERLRTSQTVDLHLSVERNREQLVQQTFKQLNQQAKRRTGSSQPLAVLRVKVQFENEPGEGTGVARSFYTAIAEALLSQERLPSLEGIIPGSSGSSSRKSSSMHLSLVARLYKREREREERSSRAGSSRSGASSSGGSDRSINLRSFLTARYRELATGGSRESSGIAPLSTQASPFVKRSSRVQSSQSSLERSKQAIGDRLFPKVSAIHSTWAAKITGMLLELPAYELLLLLRSERSLHDRVSEAADLLLSNGFANDAEDPAANAAEKRNYSDSETASLESRDETKKQEEKAKTSSKDGEDTIMGEDNEGGPPLFYQPGKRGMYAPASWGDNSESRLNAYRNVGRIIGLCLLQNELCPLPLCRHVLKLLLGRKVNWHDLAFFDPVLYESFRQLVADSESGINDVIGALDLTYVVDLQSEEGGGQVELMLGGANVSVTRHCLMDYIRRYALYRMVSCCRKQLDKMRQGLLDVLPRSSIHNLTAEDLRLLFNGCGHVDVHTLISYTLFNDESGKTGAPTEKLTQFKRWFWAVVDRMNNVERQDLLYFWTGSPALPASEDGFQPMPSVTIRPPDDQHLPTANTCISRLYVPLYSSRQILKQKLLIAITTKNFGFV